MPIYIQSRGKKQDQDYRWLRIKKNEYYPKNPDFLLQHIGSSIRPIDLIESQKFSVILAATEDRYYLLVTGLKARQERTDFTGRLVRNSVLWEFKKDNELKIRSLLIMALRGEIDSELDKSINIGSEYGFEVDYDRLNHLSNSIAIENNQNTDLNCKLGKNCDSLREELALELENNLLPNRKDLLVLVTSIKSASTLKETGVWRGLSNRIEFEQFKVYNSLNVKAEKKTLWLWIAIAMLLIAIAIIIIWHKPQTKTNPSSPNLKESTLLQKESGDFSNKALTSIELPLVYLNQKEINYIPSPCSLNVENN